MRRLVPMHSEGDHPAGRAASPYLARGLAPVLHRHLQVHQDDLRQKPLGQLNRLLAICRLADHLDPTGQSQGHPQLLPHLGDVIGYQHTDWAHSVTHS